MLKEMDLMLIFETSRNALWKRRKRVFSDIILSWKQTLFWVFDILELQSNWCYNRFELNGTIDLMAQSNWFELMVQSIWAELHNRLMAQSPLIWAELHNRFDALILNTCFIVLKSCFFFTALLVKATFLATFSFLTLARFSWWHNRLGH